MEISRKMQVETMFIDGCDEAVVGYACRCGQPPIVVYSHQGLVSKFVRDGMSEEDAEEWVSVNIVGAWLGLGTPAVLVAASADDVREVLL